MRHILYVKLLTFLHEFSVIQCHYLLFNRWFSFIVIFIINTTILHWCPLCNELVRSQRQFFHNLCNLFALHGVTPYISLITWSIPPPTLTFLWCIWSQIMGVSVSLAVYEPYRAAHQPGSKMAVAVVEPDWFHGFLFCSTAGFVCMVC